MRDSLLFYVNGSRRQVAGEAALGMLSAYLREDLRLTGTKVVCAEGDCGACSVLVGRFEGDTLRYRAVDSCIQFLHQIHGTHVVTVEGLGYAGGLSPVQSAMVEHHGSQCGFCTPGIVAALTEVFEAGNRIDEPALRSALTGNLCRCTGYLPILEAGLAVDAAGVRPLGELYASPTMIEELRAASAESVTIEAGGRTYARPVTLADALELKARQPHAVIVSGATELGVQANKKHATAPTLLSLAGVPGLDGLGREEGLIAIGANVTLTQLEAFARAQLPEFASMLGLFGSPQIRNVATLVGNIAHGSPIADTVGFLLLMGAELEIASLRGPRRVGVGAFLKGYKSVDLAPDEIITRVLIPLPEPGELLRLYKVSERKDMDIATFGAGIRMALDGEVIARVGIAYSGVGPTVQRMSETEAFLRGRPFEEATFRDAGHVARSEIRPIGDVRGSREFRSLLAGTILLKFYWEARARLGPEVAIGSRG